jgi:protein-S-isoprenylcysteine O-methyltransferase Ste14
MKNTTHRLSLGKAIGVALGGIIISGVVTLAVWVAWFFSREVIMGNQDNLIALMIQSVACLALFLIGVITSVVCAVRLRSGQKLMDKKE